MSFLSFSLDYYKKKIDEYETMDISEPEIYEAKQLLKMLDDLVDEGYDRLYSEVEKQFNGVTRLKGILALHNEKPFPLLEYTEDRKQYEIEIQQLDDCLNDIMNKAEKMSETSNNPILDEITQFCDWIDYDEDTAYIFLLRDALLPYIYFAKEKNRELHPWLIGRKFIDFLLPGSYIDDIVRGSFFDALDAGCNDFESFKEFCQRKMVCDLQPYPIVIETVSRMLKKVQKEKILVIESGCYGTFPMLLSVLDERVNFRMFTTVPYLAEIYRERIFTNAYEKNRLFETLYSQDKLFQFEMFKDGEFYVSRKLDDSIEKQALKEIKRMQL